MATKAKKKPPAKAVVTVPEAAAMLGIDPRHVRRLLDAGEITEAPAVGRQRMAVAASVAAWERKRAPNGTLTVNGRTQTLSEWAAETGISRKTLGWRLHAGWQPRDIIKPE